MAMEPSAAADPSRVVLIRSPGRVNLIGEHTDYNSGLVMPAAIDLEIRLAIVPTRDSRVSITLASTGEMQGFDLGNIGSPSGGWVDYARGVAVELLAAGYPVAGFRGLLASTLPQGAGLSSSAALELAVLGHCPGGTVPRPTA